MTTRWRSAGHDFSRSGDSRFRGRRRSIICEESLVAAAELLPNLVLIDVNLPGIDGLEATRRLRGHDCPPAVLLLSTYNEDLGEQFVAEFGAMAYVTESAFGPEVLEAVRSTAVR